MAKIILKLHPQLQVATLHGKKNCTSRSRIKGNVGDLFDCCGQLYRITHILETKLDIVAYELYGAEGFNSPGDFVEFWNKNIRPFSASDVVYAHFYAAVIPVNPTKEGFIRAVNMEVEA